MEIKKEKEKREKRDKRKETRSKKIVLIERNIRKN